MKSKLVGPRHGVGLTDRVSQCESGPKGVRTAPLCLGQRIFFLHDGRTVDLLRRG
jgi:hypothetical protein